MAKRTANTSNPSTAQGSAAGRIFTALTLALLLVPLAGMVWAPTASTTENRTLADPPALVTEDGVPNVNLLSDAGAYFEDHFAYRNDLVSANARLRAAFGSSATDQVVVGSEGWLYYAGTLPDYLGQSTLTDRALRNIAHNLSLMQGFASSREAKFVFAVAPNKNTLYPEHMPATYLQSNQAGNWERLKPYLDEYGVSYVDLFEELGQADDVLYYQRDTHWNNEGALLGGNALLAGLGCSTILIEEDAWTSRDDYTGDVAKMLYPSAPGTEPASYAAGYNDAEGQTGSLWQWSKGTDVEEDFVQTSGNGAGNLVMFRDSFANALIPYFATQFDEATFTKLVPYDVATISVQEADFCIVERAERHLGFLAQNAPIMPAPAVNLGVDLPQADTAKAEETRLQVAEDGGYTVVSGELDKRLHNEEVRIFIEVAQDDGATRLYEASTISAKDDEAVADTQEDATSPEAEELPVIASVSSDYGFVAYLAGAPDMDNKPIRVVCLQDSGIIDVKSFTG